jgi:hypothetical protein
MCKNGVEESKEESTLLCSQGMLLYLTTKTVPSSILYSTIRSGNTKQPNLPAFSYLGIILCRSTPPLLRAATNPPIQIKNIPSLSHHFEIKSKAHLKYPSHACKCNSVVLGISTCDINIRISLAPYGSIFCLCDP